MVIVVKAGKTKIKALVDLVSGPQTPVFSLGPATAEGKWELCGVCFIRILIPS